MTAALNVTQWRFLRLFLATDLDSVRVSWTLGGQVIGRPSEPFAYHPSADGVQGYIRGDGENGLRGQAVDRTRLCMSDLLALAPCWATPLRELNDLGRQIAQTRPMAAVTRTRTFRQTETQFEALDIEAATQGRDVSELIRDALAAYLERR